jgi:hypothetical protein
LVAAIRQQPVSVNIEADKSAFQLYKGGVLDNPKCGRVIDHAVLAVGYGISTGNDSKPYYKVKNSWGKTWGESGYIRMVRDKDMCGIASSPSMPTGAKRWIPPTPAPPTPPTPPTPPPPPPAPTDCVGEPARWCKDDYNCTGSSSLSTAACHAWQAIYDGLHPPGSDPWNTCDSPGSGNRTDPCSCGNNGKIAGRIYCAGDQITAILLPQNGMKGTISESLGKLTDLTSVEFNNQAGLEGSIPESICQLSNLKVLSMGGNDMGDKKHGLHGTLPACIGNLGALQTVELFHNRLTGSIPQSFSKLTDLSVFYLYNNLLTGKVPPMEVFHRKYCGIGDAKGVDDGNYYCKPLPPNASQCNFEGAIRTRGACNSSAL